MHSGALVPMDQQKWMDLKPCVVPLQRRNALGDRMAAPPQKGTTVDDNRTKGAARQISGTAKELAGKLTGNTSKEVAGKIEKNVGKAQRNIGEAADEARDSTKGGHRKD